MLYRLEYENAWMAFFFKYNIILLFLGEVYMPSGKTATPEIVDNKDGTVTVRYAPVEVGLHEMHIKYMGNHIPGKYQLILINIRLDCKKPE